MAHVLPFERPLVELATRLRELRPLADNDPILHAELMTLEAQADKLARELFADLTAWQKVQLSRHPNRPYTLDYIGALIEDFIELAGDRAFAEDSAIVGGLGTFRGESVVVLGHQKGRGAKDNVRRNFGMPHPEGYRKAVRLYELADRFKLPILTFVDTPGAYPGIGAEERGQSEAIGRCLAAMANVHVPIITTIIGEGGSGGALALAVGNRVNILEYGTYSVITPEGCASILWKDGAKAPEAADRMKMTASDLLRLGVVDAVVAEPPGGAHQNPKLAAHLVGESIAAALSQLRREFGNIGPRIADQRYARFRSIGAFA
jgi:acetyl-CoA carboxylase carboxyl transferase subunit alpha